MIFGRADACDRIASLLSDLRRGQGGALVLAGPAGIGKSTLLDFAADRALGMLVIRAEGSPAEEGITYAGLSQVLTPLLAWLPSLVPTQAAAVEAALAIGPTTGSDSFPVYAGTLGLLAAAAAAGPVVVVVDDSQWLDSASMKAPCSLNVGLVMIEFSSCSQRESMTARRQCGRICRRLNWPDWT